MPAPTGTTRSPRTRRRASASAGAPSARRGGASNRESLGEKVRAGAAGAPETGEQTADADDSGDGDADGRSTTVDARTRGTGGDAAAPAAPPRSRADAHPAHRRRADRDRGSRVACLRRQSRWSASSTEARCAGPKPKPVQDQGPHDPRRARSPPDRRRWRRRPGQGRLPRRDPAAKGFDLAKYGAKSAPNLEGFLFPATYGCRSTGPSRTSSSASSRRSGQPGRGRPLLREVEEPDGYDVLKIASMIEREVQVPKERPLAASVIYNRLKANNPLGIDATIRYEDQQLQRAADREPARREHPYNTRTHPGCRRRRSATPGSTRSRRRRNPAKTDFFYFVVKPGTCSEHVFTKTKAEFQRARAPTSRRSRRRAARRPSARSAAVSARPAPA